VNKKRIMVAATGLAVGVTLLAQGASDTDPGGHQRLALGVPNTLRAQEQRVPPVVETVYVPERHTVLALNSGGKYDMRPASIVELRLRVATPSLETRIHIDGVRLAQVPDPGPRPSLDRQGYFYVFPDAPIESGTPGSVEEVFRRVQVALPLARRAAAGNGAPETTISVWVTGTNQFVDVIAAAYDPRIGRDPNHKTQPSEVFMSGDNAKRGGSDCRAAQLQPAGGSVAAQGVTLAGWMRGPRHFFGRNSGDEGNALRVGQSSDWHFDIDLDTDFLQRNYGSASSPLFGAVLPGDPADFLPCLNPKANDMPLVVRWPVDAGVFMLPGLGTPGAEGMIVELNAWHVSDRGAKPRGWSADPHASQYPDNAWPFDPLRPGIRDPADPLGSSELLAEGQYVIVSGTLWQDSPHLRSDEKAGNTGSPAYKLRKCFEDRFRGQSGWLEVHPLNSIRRVREPALRRHVALVSACAPPEQSSVAYAALRARGAPTFGAGSSVLRFREILDPRFTVPGTFRKSVGIVPHDPHQLEVRVQTVGNEGGSFSGVYVLWWEKGTPPPPVPIKAMVLKVEDRPPPEDVPTASGYVLVTARDANSGTVLQGRIKVKSKNGTEFSGQTGRRLSYKCIENRNNRPQRATNCQGTVTVSGYADGTFTVNAVPE
jgi:hypothetical protein